MHRLLLIALLALPIAVSATGFHTWVDDSGRRHISNVPPEYLNPDGTIRSEWKYRNFADPAYLARRREAAVAAEKRRLEQEKAEARQRILAQTRKKRSVGDEQTQAIEEELRELRTKLRREEGFLATIEADRRTKIPHYAAEDVPTQQQVVADLEEQIAELESKLP